MSTSRKEIENRHEQAGLFLSSCQKLGPCQGLGQHSVKGRAVAAAIKAFQDANITHAYLPATYLPDYLIMVILQTTYTGVASPPTACEQLIPTSRAPTCPSALSVF